MCNQGIILHPPTVYLCSFKELYLFNFKEMDILVNCQGNTDLFKEHIFIHKKYNHSRQLNSDTKLY